jgi:hypothetical protein
MTMTWFLNIAANKQSFASPRPNETGTPLPEGLADLDPRGQFGKARAPVVPAEFAGAPPF